MLFLKNHNPKDIQTQRKDDETKEKGSKKNMEIFHDFYP